MFSHLTSFNDYQLASNLSDLSYKELAELVLGTAVCGTCTCMPGHNLILLDSGKLDFP